MWKTLVIKVFTYKQCQVVTVPYFSTLDDSARPSQTQMSP